MNERNQKKETMKTRITGIMEKDPERYCGDNVHQIVVDVIALDFGITLTPEIITKISSIDRTRQLIQSKNKDLNQKSSKIDAMEANDTEYYGTDDGRLFDPETDWKGRKL